MYPIVRTIQSQDQLNELTSTMKEDNHVPLFPTHEIRSEDGSEIIGYFSLIATPVLNFWMHTKKAKSRDSWFALQVAENLARSVGAKALVLPCKTASPYYKFLPALGYVNMGNFDLSIKNL